MRKKTVFFFIMSLFFTHFIIEATFLWGKQSTLKIPNKTIFLLEFPVKEFVSGGTNVLHVAQQRQYSVTLLTTPLMMSACLFFHVNFSDSNWSFMEIVDNLSRKMRCAQPENAKPIEAFLFKRNTKTRGKERASECARDKNECIHKRHHFLSVVSIQVV